MNDLQLIVKKAQRRLQLYQGTLLECSYAIALGRNSGIDKVCEGDEATPLGRFYVCAKNPRSKFFLSLCLSYPNAAHAQRGLAAGLITAAEHAEILAALAAGRMPPQKTRLGGEIYIHGLRGGAGEAPQSKDWTHGCIALDNASMAELYARVTLGTRVDIEE
jgi:murein L,D-transpeptidase YafK